MSDPPEASIFEPLAILPAQWLTARDELDLQPEHKLQLAVMFGVLEAIARGMKRGLRAMNAKQRQDWWSAVAWVQHDDLRDGDHPMSLEATCWHLSRSTNVPVDVEGLRTLLLACVWWVLEERPKGGRPLVLQLTGNRSRYVGRKEPHKHELGRRTNVAGSRTKVVGKRVRTKSTTTRRRKG